MDGVFHRLNATFQTVSDRSVHSHTVMRLFSGHYSVSIIVYH